LDVAWCGDSQLGLFKNGSLEFLTETHKPEDPNEKQRIENLGGSVIYAGYTWRVNGSLSVARAFGNSFLL
jgi:serine/threonine protein phosphatase PrpC